MQRLTLTLFLFFLFVGYLLLRGAVLETSLRARYSAPGYRLVTLSLHFTQRVSVPHVASPADRAEAE